MFKMIINVTQSFETVEAAQVFYNEIKDELRKYTDLHINGQIVRKFTGYSPENPNGHEVEA